EVERNSIPTKHLKFRAARSEMEPNKAMKLPGQGRAFAPRAPRLVSRDNQSLMKAMRFLPATAAVLTFLANQTSGAPMAWPPNHYQGSLTERNAPASGLYDFEIRLFDAGTNGNSIGIVLCNSEPVESGLFTLALNWPDPIVFDGESRWLELSV